MQQKISLTALTIEQLATILKRLGSRSATPENIRKDIAAGAPVNEDGTISVILYVAWLAKEERNDKPE